MPTAARRSSTAEPVLPRLGRRTCGATACWSSTRRARSRPARATGPLYLATDTHWRPEAMEMVAEQLGAFIASHGDAARRGPIPAIASSGSNSGTPATSRACWTCRHGDTLFPPESVWLARVLLPDGSAWRSSRDADVLVLGDSFSNIYSLESMGWGTSAGLRAFELRLAPAGRSAGAERRGGIRHAAMLQRIRSARNGVITSWRELTTRPPSPPANCFSEIPIASRESASSSTSSPRANWRSGTGKCCHWERRGRPIGNQWHQRRRTPGYEQRKAAVGTPLSRSPFVPISRCARAQAVGRGRREAGRRNRPYRAIGRLAVSGATMRAIGDRTPARRVDGGTGST